MGKVGDGDFSNKLRYPFQDMQSMVPLWSDKITNVVKIVFINGYIIDSDDF